MVKSDPAADGLHHPYVKRGSGKVLYSILSSDYTSRGMYNDAAECN